MVELENDLNMDISNQRIDKGQPFDWGRTSDEYAKYRDIYPDEFYQKVIDRGLCIEGQKVLDLGTGTGVLPRNMAKYGAKWTGVDISENQIEKARELSQGMDIDYIVSSVEDLDLDGTFDVITACQCFWYFDHEKITKKLYDLLKPNGHLVVLQMAWLPFEDKIAKASEDLVLQYNPSWTGARVTRYPVKIAPSYNEYFEKVYDEVFDLNVPFTRQSWAGRMHACRGIGASLTPDQIDCFNKEHKALLEKIAPEQFDILHFGAIAILKKR